MAIWDLEYFLTRLNVVDGYAHTERNGTEQKYSAQSVAGLINDHEEDHTTS